MKKILLLLSALALAILPAQCATFGLTNNTATPTYAALWAQTNTSYVFGGWRLINARTNGVLSGGAGTNWAGVAIQPITLSYARLASSVINSNTLTQLLTSNTVTVYGAIGAASVLTNSASGSSGGSSSPPVYVSIYTNNAQLYVDIAGNDSTAIRGRPDKQFISISNAIAASKSKDTINVGVGYWSEYGNFCSNNLNYNFSAGSSLVLTDAVVDSIYNFIRPPVFSDHLWAWLNDQSGNNLITYDAVSPDLWRSQSSTNYIHGDGNFSINYKADPLVDGAGFASPLIWLAGSNTVMFFECHSIVMSNSYNAIGIFDAGAKYFQFKADYIDWTTTNVSADESLQSPFYYNGGRADFSCDYLTVHGTGIGIAFGNLNDPSGGWDSTDASVVTFHLKYLNAADSTFPAIWWYGANNLVQQQFIYADDIEAGSAPALDSVGGGGKWYIEMGGQGKISNHSTTNPVVLIEGDTAFGDGKPHWAGNTTNLVWIETGKITDNNGGGFYGYYGSRTNTGNVKFFVNEWEEKSPNYVVGFNIHTGTHAIGGATAPVVIPNGRGMQISNAVVTVNGMTINTAATGNSTNDCIFLQGNGQNLVTLNNCTLIASNGVNAINATNAQTINLNFCKVQGGVSANVTINGIWYSNSAAGVPTLYVNQTAK